MNSNNKYKYDTAPLRLLMSPSYTNKRSLIIIDGTEISILELILKLFNQCLNLINNPNQEIGQIQTMKFKISTNTLKLN